MLSTEEFIIRVSQLHQGKYDYSLTIYVGTFNKVKIICPIHGVFEQKPNDHLSNKGCPKCSGKNKSDGDILLEMNNKHHKKYEYPNFKYNGNIVKISILCPIHGIFTQRVDSHMNGRGCPICGGTKKYGINKLLIKLQKIHNNFYDYSLIKYDNVLSKVKIICPKHGLFEQRLDTHLNGHGCPICSESKGEKLIRTYLNINNIKNEPQKKISGCVGIKPLSFDFYLPEYNTCIEFDGKQHYEPVEYFGGEKTFKDIQKRDSIKTEFCVTNNINLIRIKYIEINNICNILDGELKTIKYI